MKTSRDCLYSMFKIKELKLLDNEKLINGYSFEEENYFYANNNLGKTLLVTVLDYMLGSSSLNDVFDREGMSCIERIELNVETLNGLYIFLRTKDKQYYKLSDDSDYQPVDLDTYKNKINESLVPSSNQELIEYNGLYGEELSFRSLSFLNFIDEIGLGDIANVFTRQHQIKHIFRITSIFDFLFNYNTIKKKIEIEKKIEEKESLLNRLSRESSQYQSALTELEKVLSKYNFAFSADIDYLRKCIASIRISANDEKKTIQNGKLYELIKEIHNLSNEIKQQELLQEHSNSVLTRSKKAEEVLIDFKKLLSGSELQSEYIEEIETIFKNEAKSQSILLSKDYSETINNLKNKKKALEQELSLIEYESKLPTLEEKLADAEISANYLQTVINGKDNAVQIEALKESISQLKAALKGLAKRENAISSEVNNAINEIYLSYSNIKFVEDDKNINGFGIVFNYKTLSVCGKKFVKDIEKYYLPGSLAKMTSWQVCTYLALLKYIITKRNVPVLPVLCIDGLYQPFDKSSDGYPELLRMIIESAHSCGVQVIITSTEYNDGLKQLLDEHKVNVVDLNKGFNGAYGR